MNYILISFIVGGLVVLSIPIINKSVTNSDGSGTSFKINLITEIINT